MKSIENAIKSTALLVNDKLNSILPSSDIDTKVIYDASNYSLLNGGKRIRPFILFCFSKAFDGKTENALSFASAIEMVHTYSLIHDDLPCMDNDDYRRGKPSNHKVFGEATALLAGDALLTEAFSVISRTDLAPDILIKAVNVLSECAGCRGMIGGQVMDMSPELLRDDIEKLKKMYRLKTGMLISASAKLGCLAAGISDDTILNSAENYSYNIGMAFQIIDDILDRYGNQNNLGKPIGSDEKNNKTTFLSFMTKDEAYNEAKRLTELAIKSIENIPNNRELCELGYYLLNRKK